RRTRRGSFGGAFVFPGGLVDNADRDTSLVNGGEELAKRCALRLCEPGLAPDLAIGLFAAGVRETFEEAGVLVGAGKECGPPGEVPDAPDLRRKLEAGEMTLKQLLLSLGLSLKPDLLLPFARWITPPEEARRFDTRFFVARHIAGQRTSPNCNELTEGVWISPGRALEEHRAGRMKLFPPTWATLWELNLCRDADAVLNLARNRVIRPIRPKTFADKRGVGVLLPHDSEYGQGGFEAVSNSLPSRLLLSEKGWLPAS
ncbi:MAG: hypothetical protein QMD09_04320, partial [Desulfatibacillaceae bacterium]|nr:hypothetical protein [Desulfatibacillaceae bacterium]